MNVPFATTTRRQDGFERRVSMRADVTERENRGSTTRNIFVIDDMLSNVALLAATLRKIENVAVSGFTTAVEALVQCEKSPPDLILVDYQMPDMDGVEFIRHLRELPTCGAIPIIVVTGQDETDLVARAIDAGAHDFLRKPVDRIELVARARSMLRLSEANKRLYRYATLDELTGLGNRRSFLALVGAELALARSDIPNCLAIFDIDFFKTINDRFGHPAGDEVLREVARRLMGAVRTVDTWGRLGGEEFGLLMPCVDAIEAWEICESVRLAVAATPIAIDAGCEIVVTVSGGFALGKFEDTSTAWLARADVALYQAKRDGRDMIQSST